MDLEIFRLNNEGCRIIPADPTLLGQAHKEALKYCGPFIHANGAGWWVYPPIDIDISYGGNGRWEKRIISEYSHGEVELLTECAKKFGSKSIDLETKMMSIYGLDKSKYSFGMVEPDVFNFWTGCVFRMPPGWSLLITNPVNIATNRPFSVQNAIIEVDWLRVDHWINFKWNNPYQWACLRRDQELPIAQLIPIPKQSYDKGIWKAKEVNLYEDAKAFSEWDDYYYQKFVKNSPEKDSTTYHRNRKAAAQDAPKCPYHH